MQSQLKFNKGSRILYGSFFIAFFFIFVLRNTLSNSVNAAEMCCWDGANCNDIAYECSGQSCTPGSIEESCDYIGNPTPIPFIPTSTPAPTPPPPPTPTDPPTCPDGSSPPCTCGNWDCTSLITPLPGTGGCNAIECPTHNICTYDDPTCPTEEYDTCSPCFKKYAPVWVRVVSYEGGQTKAWKGTQSSDTVQGSSWSVDLLGGDGFFQQYSAYSGSPATTFSRTINQMSGTMNLTVESVDAEPIFFEGELWSNHYCARGKASGSNFPTQCTGYPPVCSADQDGCVFPLVGGTLCDPLDTSCDNQGEFGSLKAAIDRLNSEEANYGMPNFSIPYDGQWTMTSYVVRKIGSEDQEAALNVVLPEGYQCKRIATARVNFDSVSGNLDTNFLYHDIDNQDGSNKVWPDLCYTEFTMPEEGAFVLFEIEGAPVCTDQHSSGITSDPDGNSNTYTRDENVTVSGTARDWSSTSDPGVESVQVKKNGVVVATLPVVNGVFSGPVAASTLSPGPGSESVTLTFTAILNSNDMCANWDFPETRTINIENAVPQAETLSISNSLGSVKCIDEGCNGQDVITTSPVSTNSSFRFRARFSDADTPINAAWIIFDNNNTGDDGAVLYQIKYTRSPYSIVEEASTYRDYLALSDTSVTTVGDAIIIEGTVSTAGMSNYGAGGPFLSNVYLQATDSEGASSGRVLKVGLDSGWSTVSPGTSSSAIYPWQKAGIGAAWTDEANSLTKYTNGSVSGTALWTYDRTINRFAGQGIPGNFQGSYGGVISAGPGGILPWTNGGPTSAWEDRVSGLNYICNGSYCWTWNYNTAAWSGPR